MQDSANPNTHIGISFDIGFDTRADIGADTRAGAWASLAFRRLDRQAVSVDFIADKAKELTGGVQVTAG